MRIRALTLGFAVAVAAAGLVPAGLSAASAATMPAPGSVDVVTPLPAGISFHGGAFFRGMVKLPLPAGFQYKDGGVYDPSQKLVVAPAGAHEAVIEAPMECKGGTLAFAPVTTSNFLANIINGAFNAARAGVEAASGIAQAAVGAASTPGAKC